ncbi:tRNA (guanosine(37)-N1)-methyltransferase TrmD [Candidatus Peregrinibacteria bacterium]|nr:tRNA (guanosine(37)-N1)-methyltransferase TrmD [Candidatus Peregrinibacteria bacterium]
MRIDVLTLFPGMFSGPMNESILRRAQEEKIVELHLYDLREFGMGNHRQVDDSPYGGGAGMVMRVDVLVNAIESISKGEQPHRIYLSPRGKRLTQSKVEKLAKKDWLLFVCGHYEGVDQRVVEGGWIDEEISIGDYVLTGGELPAMVLIDAIARQLPGVLGKEESSAEESFSKALDRRCEYPHYTRPEEFRGLGVPDILLSGNHTAIKEWRQAHLE